MNGAHAAVQRRNPQSECTKCLIEGAGWFVLGWLRMTERDILPGVPVAEMEWMKRAVAIHAPSFFVMKDGATVIILGECSSLE